MFSPTFQPKSIEGGNKWWLAGGINPANCVAAYQAKGVADLATSYINLANPGTYNAVVGSAPTWNAYDGWVFGGASYLRTGITGATNVLTSIIRFSNAKVGTRIFGTNVYGKQHTLSPNYYTVIRMWIGNSENSYAQPTASGIVCINAMKLYIDGIYKINLVGSTGITLDFYIGAAHEISDPPIYYFTGNIQALAIYNQGMSSDTCVALTAAMAAL